MEKSPGRGEGERGTGRTGMCIRVSVRLSVRVCCGQEGKRAWCCAILESNGTVPAGPADSAVPSASPQVKPRSSIRRHFSRQIQILELEKPCRCFCVLLGCAHLSSDVITVNCSPSESPSQTRCFANAGLRAQWSLSVP